IQVSNINMVFPNFSAQYINIIKGNISGWFLSRIESPNQDNYIVFNYTPVTRLSLTGFNGTIFNWEGDVPEGWYAFPSPHVGNGEGLIYQGLNVINTYMLNSITTSNGIEISLSANVEREDLIEEIRDHVATGKNALEKIIISFDGNPVKEWEFEYDYFTSGITTSQAGHINAQALNKRLKLISLKQNMPDGMPGSLNPYIFSYFGDDSGSGMPFKNCCTGRDRYGYCNSDVTDADEAAYPLNLFPNTLENSSGYLEGMLGNVYNCDVEWHLCPPGAPPPLPPIGYVHPLLIAIKHFQEQGKYYDFEEGSNMEPNINYTKLYTLKEVKYPTGGTTMFDYELNIYNKTAIQGTYGDYPRNGGGLRIKTMTTIDPYSDEEMNTEYIYQNSGFITSEQKWAKPHLTRNADYGWRLNIGLSSNPIINSNPVRYTYVTESTQLGSIHFTYVTPFSSPGECPQSIYESVYFGMYGDCLTFEEPLYFTGPIYPYTKGYQEWQFFTGMLKAKDIFDVEDNLIKLEENTYEFIQGDYIYFMEAHKWDESTSGYNYRVNISRMPTGKSFLKETNITEYLDDGSGNTTELTTTTTFLYDYENELLKENTLHNSNGKINKTIYRYPCDLEYNAGQPTDDITRALIHMVERKMLNYPIEKIEYFDNNIITSQVNLYSEGLNNTGSIYLYQTHNLETTDPILESDYTFLHFIPGSTGPPELEEKCKLRIMYDKYDSQGNILEFRYIDGIRNTILWSYDFLFPVAKIENATYSEVVSNIGCTYDDLQEKSDSELMLIFENLRTALPDAMITSYIYKPFVGLSSVTDPSGITIFYEYDSYGRLETITDQDGNITKHIDYHYKDE
ncbi:MAG: hypothetical protein K8R68_07285, partial [Bacteroidales bacterium]|nr:hypothetical protein [Bacteroidales bacterium]